MSQKVAFIKVVLECVRVMSREFRRGPDAACVIMQKRFTFFSNSPGRTVVVGQLGQEVVERDAVRARLLRRPDVPAAHGLVSTKVPAIFRRFRETDVHIEVKNHTHTQTKSHLSNVQHGCC